MSAQITVLVELAIADGKAGDFERISRKLLEIVRSKEPGTLSFSQFFNEDRSLVSSLETYADSDALIAHMTNASASIHRVEEIAKVVRTEIFGDVKDEVKDMFRVFNTKIFRPFSEFTR